MERYLKGSHVVYQCKYHFVWVPKYRFRNHEYRTLLDQFGMKASMSRKGNWYDNALMESLWGILKNELVHHRRYATRAEAIREIREYIEIFYNRQRRQAMLGYLSPAAYERKFYVGRLAA